MEHRQVGKWHSSFIPRPAPIPATGASEFSGPSTSASTSIGRPPVVSPPFYHAREPSLLGLAFEFGASCEIVPPHKRRAVGDADRGEQRAARKRVVLHRRAVGNVDRLQGGASRETALTDGRNARRYADRRGLLEICGWGHSLRYDSYCSPALRCSQRE